MIYSSAAPLLIRSVLSVKLFLSKIEESNLRLYGHVEQIDDVRLARKYLEWKPQGKRPFGRPWKRWLDGVGEALERRGLRIVKCGGEKNLRRPRNLEKRCQVFAG